MAEPDDRQHDRLSPQTVHDLLVLLTVIRGQEHMIKRWVRLRDDVAGVEQTLERLATTDALILRLASELIARQTVDDGEATDDTR